MTLAVAELERPLVIIVDEDRSLTVTRRPRRRAPAHH